MVHYGDMTKCYQIFWRSMFQIYFVTYITKYILAVESISNGHLLLQCLVPAVAIRRQPDPTHPQMALLHPTNGNTIQGVPKKMSDSAFLVIAASAA